MEEALNNHTERLRATSSTIVDENLMTEPILDILKAINEKSCEPTLKEEVTSDGAT